MGNGNTIRTELIAAWTIPRDSKFGVNEATNKIQGHISKNTTHLGYTTRFTKKS